MKQVRYAEQAIRELDAIFAWIASDNPAAAERVLDRLDRTAALLSQFRIGRPGRTPGTRELVVGRLPYIIVYSESADAITILAVRHAARRPLG
ncbi:type II toxin-antitoxin system RelE/ParE family toxin [Methylopila henanensis]|uniref:Type II toxin-antitoxin system RelE/ParE family toxin n=1 Tax=Methylopila henanensis TaxID=873516 RepID=A0ABW4K9L2_9HYPH